MVRPVTPLLFLGIILSRTPSPTTESSEGDDPRDKRPAKSSPFATAVRVEVGGRARTHKSRDGPSSSSNRNSLPPPCELATPRSREKKRVFISDLALTAFIECQFLVHQKRVNEEVESCCLFVVELLVGWLAGYDYRLPESHQRRRLSPALSVSIFHSEDHSLSRRLREFGWLKK